MIRAVDFHREADLRRQEIHDEPIKWNLAAKCHTELFPGKGTPEELL
jgi:hypothetical protein